MEDHRDKGYNEIKRRWRDFKEAIVYTRVFFPLGWIVFQGVWENQGGTNFLGLVSLYECRVDIFLSLSFVLIFGWGSTSFL